MQKYSELWLGASGAPALANFPGMIFLALIIISVMAYPVSAAAKATTTTLSSIPNPSTYGQAVTFTAKVSSSYGSIPNGETVSFSDGSKVIGPGLLSSGSATITVNSLATGSHSIVATYGGDANFAPSASLSFLQTVRPAPSSVSLTSNLNPSAYGQAVTFTARVSSSGGPIPNGEIVSFSDGYTIIGSSVLSSGTGTFTTSSLSSGSHLITALYAGDANFTSKTSSSLKQVVQSAPSSSATTSVTPSQCFLWLNVSSGAPYYVVPQKIVIFYTVKQVGSCNITAATGTLSLSNAKTGTVYASVPINVTNILGVSVTRVAYVNSSTASQGPNLAIMLLSSGSHSNLSSTSFYVLLPANVTIRSIRASPNVTQTGYPVSIVTNLFNNAFFGAINTTLNLRIVSPNSSVYSTRQYLGRISAFQNTTVTINPGIGGVAQLPGKYLVLENLSFYTNYSTSSIVFSSNAFYSNTSATSYDAYPNKNLNYSLAAGYPTPPTNLSQVQIRSFPYYKDVLTGSGALSGLGNFIVYNSGGSPIGLALSIPRLQFGRIASSVANTSIQPNQNATIQLNFTSSGNATGSYLVPINVSLVYANGSASKTQLYTVLNLNNRSVVPQLLSSIRLLNGNKNASVSMTILNSRNTSYNLFLSTQLNSSVAASVNSILLNGQGGNLSLGNKLYSMSWAVGKLGGDAAARVGYSITNITQAKYLLVPRTFLSSTRQLNSTLLIVLGIQKPQSIITNTTINITVRAIYVGVNATTVNLTLASQGSAKVYDPHRAFSVIPGSDIAATFAVNVGPYVGNEILQLITPGQFVPQTQSITLSVVQKPVQAYTIGDYLSDPRTIFGALALIAYIVSISYGRVMKLYRERKTKQGEATVRSVEALRGLTKRTNEATVSAGKTKRTFRRHLNNDGSLGGFVEESAIVGRDAVVAHAAVIENGAIVSGDAKILEGATISGHAVVRAGANVYGNAVVGDGSEVYGNAQVYGDARVFGDCEVYDNARVYGDAEVFGDAHVYGEAQIFGRAKVYGSARVSGDARVRKTNISKGEVVSGAH